MGTAAASLLSRAAVPQNLGQNSQQLSPSVIWVGATAQHSPSAGVASSEAADPTTIYSALAPTAAEPQEPQNFASTWLQLRGKLETSLRAHQNSPLLDGAEQTWHAAAPHSALAKEVALMQVDVQQLIVTI